MKRLALLLALAIAGPALAQPPRELTANDTISIRVQQSKTFRFDYPVNKITLAAKDIAEVIPETDRTFIVRGISQGTTLMTAYSADGSVLHRSNLEVLQAGGFVKIYGLGAKDFAGFFCTEYGCGRSNPDLGTSPFSTIISNTQPRPDGSSQTISREYR
jgi:hypothetical protein